MRLGASLAGLVAACVACAAPEATRAVPPRAEPLVVAELRRAALDDGGAAPSALLELPAPDDRELARVGTQVVRKSQVFDRLVDRDPALAQALVDLCVLDLVVADAARRFSIDVRAEELEVHLRAEEAVLRLEAKAEGDDAAFAAFLGDRLGLTLAEYHARLRREVERVLWRSYTIRYLALREDRVRVRFLVHEDQKVLADVAERMARGADFAALARRLSQDASAADGGALPPFSRGFAHPIARVAFELAAGELSAPVPIDARGRFALVWCVERLPARDVPFDAVREAIVAELETRPVTPFEQDAFVARYCRTSPRENGEPETRR